LLEKLTRSPNQVQAEDLAWPRQAGVSDAALRDAVYVCALFNLIDRVSDALDFAIPTERGFDTMAKVLLRFGYRSRI
jgi:alkylhydroperoxidase family enzyme